MRLGEAVAVGRALGLRHLALHCTQRRVAIEDMLDGRPRQRWRLLAHSGDAPVARNRAVAGFRVQLVLEQREQARLAGAVGADQSHAPAGMQLQVRLLDEAARTTRERQSSEQDQWRGADRIGVRILAMPRALPVAVVAIATVPGP
jgi:hypothetical protein